MSGSIEYYMGLYLNRHRRPTFYTGAKPINPSALKWARITIYIPVLAAEDNKNRCNKKMPNKLNSSTLIICIFSARTDSWILEISICDSQKSLKSRFSSFPLVKFNESLYIKYPIFMIGFWTSSKRDFRRHRCSRPAASSAAASISAIECLTETFCVKMSVIFEQHVIWHKYSTSFCHTHQSSHKNDYQLSLLPVIHSQEKDGFSNFICTTHEAHIRMKKLRANIVKPFWPTKLLNISRPHTVAISAEIPKC